MAIPHESPYEQTSNNSKLAHYTGSNLLSQTDIVLDSKEHNGFTNLK